MRQRLNFLVLGLASLIVVAFVVPLALTVRQQADQRGRLSAERTAQTLAAVVVRAAAASDTGLAGDDVESLLGPIPAGSAIVMPEGTILGPGEPDFGLIDSVVTQQGALSAYGDDSFGLAIPVTTQSGTVVVYSSVSDEVLNQGVAVAWALLALLGIGLVAASVFASDRLGRSVVGPSRRIASAAERLGKGELDSRVDEEGPPELVAIAAAFNTLALRIRALLDEERESLADLSHRLRTPLTALRLQVEQVGSPEEKAVLLAKVDNLGMAISELITQARTRSEPVPAVSDVSHVVRTRSEFWDVLAKNQGRGLHVEVGESPVLIQAREEDTAAAIDALIGNVFAHTEAGTNFGIAVRRVGPNVEIEVADSGPGFPAGFDPADRGASGGDSSGLGLDIVRQFAQEANGVMRTVSSPLGGARVILEIPVVNDQAS